MAVDLGIANTLVYVAGRGVVVFEPSMVAIDQRTDEVYAVGTKAERRQGRVGGLLMSTGWHPGSTLTGSREQDAILVRGEANSPRCGGRRGGWPSRPR